MFHPWFKPLLLKPTTDEPKKQLQGSRSRSRGVLPDQEQQHRVTANYIYMQKFPGQVRMDLWACAPSWRSPAKASSGRAQSIICGVFPMFSTNNESPLPRTSAELGKHLSTVENRMLNKLESSLEKKNATNASYSDGTNQLHSEKTKVPLNRRALVLVFFLTPASCQSKTHKGMGVPVAMVCKLQELN